MSSITQQTLDSLKDQLNSKNFDPAALAKAITQSTGLVAIDLEAPSKKLFPALSPLRNELPRFVDGKGGTAVQWRGVLAQNASAGSAPGNYQVSVVEGQRNAAYNLSTANYLGSYKSIGIEQSVTFEAEFAGQTFEDMKGLAVLTNLRSLMVKEELLLVGGNNSMNLGQTPTLTSFSTATTGGTITTGATLYVACVYLSYEGLQASSISGGVVTRTQATGADGLTFYTGYGAALISATANSTVGSSTNTNTLTATVPTKAGVAGYAWFWGATYAGATLGAITTINSYTIKTMTGTGTQTEALYAAANSSDYSANPNSFDGLITLCQVLGQQVGNTVSQGYNLAVPAGYQLTSDGAAGIVEIDAMLKDRWDNYRLGFDTLWVNSQEATSITKLVVQNGGAPLVRFVSDGKGADRSNIGGATFVNSYWNKYTGQEMRVIVHPFIQAGTILATAKELPYPVNGVNQVNQVRPRRDYYEIDWPIVSRQYPYGLYSDEFVQNYFQAAIGTISNLTAN